MLSTAKWQTKQCLVNHIICRIPSNRLRVYLYRNIGRMRIGANVCLDYGLRFYGWEGLVIGAGTVVNWGTILDGRGGLSIGSSVNISPEVAILTAQHDLSSSTFAGLEAPVHICDYVWIASRAIVLPGISVGEGAVVGAGSVVTKDVEAYTVVAGNPAIRIGQRARNLDYIPRW